MKNYLVKDLMVPISEYATVRLGTPLIEAIKTLGRSQQSFTSSKYQHRAVLVLDEDDRVVGKISQLRALKAIERQTEPDFDAKQLRKFQFSDEYIAQIFDLYRSHGKVMTRDVLEEASKKKVDEFMQSPSSGEFVAEDSVLDTAIHRLTAGPHLSLLVTRDERIIGVLRISDVFAAVFQEMVQLDS